MSAARIKSMSEAERELLAWFEIQALRCERDKRRWNARCVREALGLRAGEAVR